MIRPISTATSKEAPNASKAASARVAATPLSLAHLTVLEASPTQLTILAARAGYAFVGLRLIPVTPSETPWPLISSRAMLRETKRALADNGVGVLDVELVRLTPDLDVADLEGLLETAAELGARHVLTQVHDGDFVRAGEKYAALCDRAVGFGLTCDLEFLPWTDMRDVGDAMTFLNAVNHDHGGLCIDTLHLARSGSPPEIIDAIPPRWLHFAQICDAPAKAPQTREGLIEAARGERLWPGQGGLPLRAVIERLPPGAPLALEIPNRELALKMPAEARVRGAAEAARALLAEMQSAGDGRAAN